MKLPTVLVSSVYRSARSNQSHGGVFMVNLQNNKFKNLLLAKQDIDLHGRGGERGFRGIAFWKNNIYIGLHDGVQIYNKNFKLLDTIRNKSYLGNVHEICIHKNKLYIVSTMYDAIVSFNLNTKKMVDCSVIKNAGKSGTFMLHQKNNSPAKQDSLHLNNVFANDTGVYVCGTNISSLIKIKNGIVSKYCRVLPGTHNCRPLGGDKVICNDTRNGVISITDKGCRVINTAQVPRISKAKMTDIHVKDKIARQPFARGLAFNNNFIIGGSSPDMISVYDRNTFNLIKKINLSMNIRHCIHGLEIFPFNQGMV